MYCNICSSTELYILSTGKMSKSCKVCSIKQNESKKKNKCEHNRIKYQCRDCNGSSICEHNCRKTRCKECKGNSICEHGKIKYQCKDCNGSAFCEHGKIKSYCIDCKGNSICEHNRQKAICKECKGSSICEHNKIKYQCDRCNLKLYLIHLQRNQIAKLFKKSTLIKKNHLIKYLGITSYEFIKFFEKKINYYNNNDNIIKMNWNNIELDHIKPISLFDLDDENEFLNCSNYTNLQPLLAKDNIEKGNKWSITSEIFWNENIKDNENYIKIYNIL